MLQNYHLVIIHIEKTTDKMGQFFYSAKAFDVLERLEPNPEYWEGKRGACVGVLQLVIAGHEPKESLKEIAQILRNGGVEGRGRGGRESVHLDHQFLS